MKEKKFQIDGIDKTILKHLMKDARTPIMSIAREIWISGAAIHQRLRKLESSGLIKGSKLILDPKVLGFNMVVFVGVYLNAASKYSAVLKRLKGMPEVIESHYTTGNWSIFIKVICKNNNHLLKLLNQEIQSINGVVRTETFISLDQQIDRQIEL